MTGVQFTGDSAQCSFTFPVGPVQGQVNICDTPFWQLGTTFRPILAALFWVVFGITAIRRALDVVS
ncbi:hypothetical protein THFILI_04700 [Thermus filiformis]|uniref:Uncharacterized protein n=2 Tax=Thermus filiformis TaxID=276 RepID=A0A0D6XAB4_THEFI|nr:hypothetical protein THFILI_04700 [Thermus filiformis]